MMRRLLLVLALLVTHGTDAANSITGIFSPTTTYPAAATGTFDSADVMDCVDWVPTLGITNAINFAWKITSGTPTSGVAVYGNGGTAELGSCVATGTGLQTCSIFTPFTLAAGSIYRTCWCQTGATNPQYEAAITVLGTGFADDPVGEIFNTFGNHMGTAANGCTSGTPPPTTGALTGPQHIQSIALWISAE